MSMSTKYEISDEVPSKILCERLHVLATAVTKGKKGINREFYMSIPAQCDKDADLVLFAAAKRIKQLEAQLSGSEAIFGFCAWLTTRKEQTIMGSTDDAAPIVQLIGTFCDDNALPDPRDNYTDYLTIPEDV